MPAAVRLAGPVPHYTPAQAATGTIVILALLVTAVVVLAFRRRR